MNGICAREQYSLLEKRCRCSEMKNILFYDGVRCIADTHCLFFRPFMFSLWYLSVLFHFVDIKKRTFGRKGADEMNNPNFPP